LFNRKEQQSLRVQPPPGGIVSRTVKMSPAKISYQRNPDFGFTNELIHDLRSESNDNPKNWELLFQCITGQEDHKRFNKLMEDMSQKKT
jgi:hypothetical protein